MTEQSAELQANWATRSDLSGLPPLHTDVGTEEVLIDDSRWLYKHALRDGIEAELVITEGVPHIWQHLASFLREAVTSWTGSRTTSGLTSRTDRKQRNR